MTQYLNVHYTQADIKAAADDAEHQIMAYADVADYGLHFEYEMLGYKTGANNTEENNSISKVILFGGVAILVIGIVCTIMLKRKK